MSHAEPNVKFEPKPTNSALAKAKGRDPTHAHPLQEMADAGAGLTRPAARR
jgi:hypothetical protein